MKKMNNKGYMLVEIIMAFAITFGILFFMMNLVINIKNKNDDLLVETLVKSDQSIIMNQLVELAMSEKKDFNCDLLIKNDNTISYKNNVINIVSDYAKIGNFEKDKYCLNDGTTIYIDIPIEVKQLSDENFNVKFIYKYISAYAVYYASNNTLAFYKDMSKPRIGEEHNGNTVTDVYSGIEEKNINKAEDVPWKNYSGSITRVIVEDKIKPISTAYWFNNMVNVSNIDASNIDTSNVKNMSYMFCNTGQNTNGLDFKIEGLDKWDTSSVTNMNNMFNSTGYNANSLEIDVSKWNVSKVTNMERMFSATGKYSKDSWNIGDLSKWDTSNVTNMSYMFYNALGGAGQDGEISSVDQLQKSDANFNLGDISNWNVSNITNMREMFNSAGRVATSFYIGSLSGWDVSKVKNMERMFSGTARLSNEFNLNLNNWNVSNVETMSGMFSVTGEKATKWNIGDLSSWNVSNVTNMEKMFYASGYNATELFGLNGLSNWKDKLKKVTNMNEMFYQMGRYATNWSLDLSEWDVSNVETHNDFATAVNDKLIEPDWN